MKKIISIILLLLTVGIWSGIVYAYDSASSLANVDMSDVQEPSSSIRTLVVSNTCRGTCIVYCPSNTEITGGGCQNTGDSRMWNRVYGSGWICGGTDSSWRTVYAVCAY